MFIFHCLLPGTPINNSVEDLLGQFGVLDMKPLSIKSFFDAQASRGLVHLLMFAPAALESSHVSRSQPYFGTGAPS